MKSVLRIFLGIVVVTLTGPAAATGSSTQESFNEDASAEAYLRLSQMRCNNCTLIVRDLIEIGAISNTVSAVKHILDDDANFIFRLNLLTACSHCYRAAHYWEMNVLNRVARNDEIEHWLNTAESRSLVEYFSQ